MGGIFYVQLPFLHPAPAFGQIALGSSLNPGLGPGMEEREWLPGNYPFDELCSKKILNEFIELEPSILSCMAWQLHPAKNRGRLADVEEQRAIQAVLKPENPHPDADALACRLLYEQAQKALLLAWLQEERYLEVVELIRRYDAGAMRLARCLAACSESDEHDQGISLRPAEEILVNWRIVAFNAILFLPASMGIAVMGPMAKELEERLDFQAVPPGGSVRSCRSSAARALGATCEGLPKSMQDALLAEREWILGSQE